MTDANGLVTKITDALEQSAEMSYDESGTTTRGTRSAARSRRRTLSRRAIHRSASRSGNRPPASATTANITMPPPAWSTSGHASTSRR